MNSPFHPLQLGLGLTLWCVWFVVLYGGLSVACAVAPPAVEAGALTGLNLALLLLTLATIGALLWLAFWCWRAGQTVPEPDSRRLIARVSAGCHLIAAGATLAVGLPVVALPPCV